uniref:Proteasome subunit beta n=1 Tax=Steinernema glaseri TaxID=37863 RepID=A0A1I7ZK73_9BILA
MEVERTLNPTCTGTSVLAVAYKDGVAIMTDRVVSYGKTARYKNVCRQYRVNDQCVVAFGGDHADFQWLQNVIERQEAEMRTYDQRAKMTPKALHGYLTSLMYYRRTKMNPLWNTLIIAGMQPEPLDYDTLKPFIGVITQRGVAYKTQSVATGLGAMLLNQAIETDVRAKKGELDEQGAVDILRKCMELTIYHDCVADDTFDVTTVSGSGVTFRKPETIIGNWEIAEYNCQYE